MKCRNERGMTSVFLLSLTGIFLLAFLAGFQWIQREKIFQRIRRLIELEEQEVLENYDPDLFESYGLLAYDKETFDLGFLKDNLQEEVKGTLKTSFWSGDTVLLSTPLSSFEYQDPEELNFSNPEGLLHQMVEAMRFEGPFHFGKELFLKQKALHQATEEGQTLQRVQKKQEELNKKEKEEQKFQEDRRELETYYAERLPSSYAQARLHLEKAAEVLDQIRHTPLAKPGEEIETEEEKRLREEAKREFSEAKELFAGLVEEFSTKEKVFQGLLDHRVQRWSADEEAQRLEEEISQLLQESSKTLSQQFQREQSAKHMLREARRRSEEEWTKETEPLLREWRSHLLEDCKVWQGSFENFEKEHPSLPVPPVYEGELQFRRKKPYPGGWQRRKEIEDKIQEVEEEKGVKTLYDFSLERSQVDQLLARTPSQGASVRDAFLATEYLLKYFSHRASKAPSPGHPNLQKQELEFILFGSPVLSKNQQSMSTRLHLVRGLPNSLYAFTSSRLRAQVLPIALSIAGWTGIGVPLVQNGILFSLVAAEGWADVRALYAGDSVPLFKSDANWKMQFSLSSVTTAIDWALEEGEDYLSTKADLIANWKEGKLENFHASVEEMISTGRERVLSPFRGLLTDTLLAEGLSEAERLQYFAGQVLTLEEAISQQEGGEEKELLLGLLEEFQELSLPSAEELKNLGERELQDFVSSALAGLEDRAEAGVRSFWEPIKAKASGWIQEGTDRAKDAFLDYFEEASEDYAPEGGYGGSLLDMNYEDYLRIFLMEKLMSSERDDVLRRAFLLIQLSPAGSGRNLCELVVGRKLVLVLDLPGLWWEEEKWKKTTRYTILAIS